jgi:hypothetical protein
VNQSLPMATVEKTWTRMVAGTTHGGAFWHMANLVIDGKGFLLEGPKCFFRF